VQLFQGQFSMDSLFSSSGSILYSANLNLFSPVLPPYPNGSDQVNSDWATRILSDWQYVFEFAFGIEDDQIILPNAIFGPTLSSLRSGILSQMPMSYVIFKIQQVFFNWFRTCSGGFGVDGVHYSFSKNSPRYLLRDLLSKLEMDVLDFTMWNSRFQQGKALLTFLPPPKVSVPSAVTSFSSLPVSNVVTVVGSTSFQSADSSGLAKPCLHFICDTHLKTASSSRWFCTPGPNGICTREHYSASMVMANKESLKRMIDYLKHVDADFKAIFLGKLEAFSG
jgi:hypothetical protein